MAKTETEYKNPVDGKTYVADWKTYEPKGDVVEQDGRVVNSGIRLLSTESEFERNISVSELSKLIGYIQEILQASTEEYIDSGEILLQIELHKKEQPSFQMSYQGDLKQELLQNFYNALLDIDLKTKHSAVGFQVHFIVKKA